MTTIRALVLSSGGARGALQAGAIRALYEMGYVPDLMTGSSIGAANAAFLAMRGFNETGIAQLQKVWESSTDRDLLPTNLWWQFMRAFLKKTRGFSLEQIRAFAVSNGLAPDLRFGDLRSNIRLYPVASDLDTGQPVVFGDDPNELILDSVLASMALPPWIAPIEKDGHYLMDGGAVSSLPIEAAVRRGATEIIALDLADPQDGQGSDRNVGGFFLKLDRTVEGRHRQLEMELARAHGIPVIHIALPADIPAPFWDFRHSRELMLHGYELTRQALENAPLPQSALWRQPKEVFLSQPIEV